ncbi:MAG: ATP-binding protein [Desulfuromonadales bacterium]
MINNMNSANGASELRRLAEEKVAAQLASAASSQETDMKRLLHELQVHQVELEMQNEEQRRTLVELAEHKIHLENVIKMTPAGYFHIDLEGRFLDVNNAWLRMHGYDSPEEVIGKHFSMIQVDSGSYSALAHLDELQRGVAIPYGEFSSRRKDGSVGHHIFSAHPVVHVGNIVGFEWFIIDISERKRLEEDKLLLQQQFQQAQKLESLGVLAGGIAHDFNNILAIIIGYCSLVRMDYETSEEYIPHIETAAQRAAALCRQMLTYAGKTQSVLAQVDMKEIVAEMLTMLKATISRNVSIRADLSDAIPHINGDASQLRQVVMNLIINASEAIGEAQGVIQVSLTRTELKAGQSDKDYNGSIIPAGHYICLEVTDSGCGMDDETRRRIFEPFYTTKFTGRGLGMSALLGIITAHKGALQLSSQPGHGSTFKVYLPLQISVAEDGSPQLAAQLSWRGSGTILLAEDEEQVALILKTMLKSLGFTVIEAADGKEAVELYKKHAVDITLVVTDMGMPVMDGYELFRVLKTLNPKLPIIISSGYGDTVVTTRIPIGEIAGLVGKPYSFDQLREVLKRVLDGDRLL